MRHSVKVVALAVALLVTPAMAADGVLDGKAAAELGDYERAENWRPG